MYSVKVALTTETEKMVPGCAITLLIKFFFKNGDSAEISAEMFIVNNLS